MELFSPYLQLVRPIFYRNPILDHRERYESTGASWILQGFAEWPISADRKSQLITCTDLFADESVSKIPCLISNVMHNVSDYVCMMCRMCKSGSIIYLNKYLKHICIYIYICSMYVEQPSWSSELTRLFGFHIYSGCPRETVISKEWRPSTIKRNIHPPLHWFTVCTSAQVKLGK